MQPNVTEQKLKDLYNRVFEDEQDFCDRFFEKYYSAQNTLCVCEEDTLCSAVHVLDITLTDGEETFSSGYIFAAATYPEYRSKGYMSELLKKAIEKAKYNKKDFLFLIVGEEGLEDYYTRFGFVTVSKESEEEIQKGKGTVLECTAKKAAERLNNADGVRIHRTEQNLEDLLYVYGAKAYQNNHGMCIAYKAGNIAVIPKYIGQKSVCADVCNVLKTEKAVITVSPGTMVLPLSQKAKQKTKFSIDFLLN